MGPLGEISRAASRVSRAGAVFGESRGSGRIGGIGMADGEDRAGIVLEGEVAIFERGERAGGEPLFEHGVEDGGLERREIEGVVDALDRAEGLALGGAAGEGGEDATLGVGAAGHGTHGLLEAALGVELAGFGLDIREVGLGAEESVEGGAGIAEQESAADEVVVAEHAESLHADAVGHAVTREEGEGLVGVDDLARGGGPDADDEAVALEVAATELVGVAGGPEDAGVGMLEGLEVGVFLAGEVDGEELGVVMPILSLSPAKPTASRSPRRSGRRRRRTTCMVAMWRFCTKR